MFTAGQRYTLDVLITAFPPGSDFASDTFYSNLRLEQAGVAFDEVPEICRSLEAVGCLSCLSISRSGLVDYLRLETKGRHYKELERMERQAKWKERFIGAGFTLAIWGIKELIMWLSRG